MLILCGNFQSYNTGTSDLSMNSIADNFGLLATLLGRYEYIKVCGGWGWVYVWGVMGV